MSDAYAVAGGRGLLQREVPSSVARVYVQRLGQPFAECGGVLVGANAVLTAAHCVVGPSGAPRAGRTVWVRVPGPIRDGLGRRGVPDGLIGASRVVLPRSATTTRFSYDAALIVLREDVAGRAAELPPPWLAVPAGRTTFVYGWGPGSNEPLGRLRVARMKLRNQDACRRVPLFNRVWAPSVMRCIGARGSLSTTCQGDSGGPVFSGERDLLLGVVSFSLSTSCATQRAPGPNAIARVDCGPLRQMVDHEFAPVLELGVDFDPAVARGEATVTLPDGSTVTSSLRRDELDRGHLRATLVLPADTTDGTLVSYQVRLSRADGSQSTLDGQVEVTGRTWVLAGVPTARAEGCPKAN